jgi:hypothetical protein
VNKLLGCLICFFVSFSVHAKDIEYIGTKAKPIPLKSEWNKLPSLTFYLYKDQNFEIMEDNTVLLSGTFTDEGESISFSNNTAFANKAHISEQGDTKTCLQAVLYKPAKYAFKSDWFCP